MTNTSLFWLHIFKSISNKQQTLRGYDFAFCFHCTFLRICKRVQCIRPSRRFDSMHSLGGNKPRCLRENGWNERVCVFLLSVFILLLLRVSPCGCISSSIFLFTFQTCQHWVSSIYYPCKHGVLPFFYDDVVSLDEHTTFRLYMISLSFWGERKSF